LQSIKDKEKANLIVGIGEMMELGKETAKYHFDVGRLVADTGAKYLVVLGEHGRQVIKGASEGGMDVNRTCPVSTHAEMVEAIKAKAMKDDVILLKGSRKMTLDKVAEEIKEYFGVKAGQDVL
jgi:UDP-N-acetylmuramoyl-tripeptide--D-alanyl-D-alanine ligase